MGFKTRVEQPAPEIPFDKVEKKREEYIKRGLSATEAAELITIQNVKWQGGPLSDTEKKRERELLAKMRPAE